MSRLFAIALFVPLLCFGQGYPSKPIRLICPFPPGGAVDIASRASAIKRMTDLGYNIIPGTPEQMAD